MTTIIEIMLLTFLILAAISVCVMKRLLASVIVLSSYSLVMSIVWILLASPDLAITEAAVGAGITGILFYVVLKRIRAIEAEHRKEEELKRNAG